MPTLLLHAGTSKAGSTAIQALMSSNRREMGGRGIEYFPVLKGPNHTALAAAFCHRRARVFRSTGIESDRDRRRWQHELGKRLSRALEPESTWVASCEHLGTQLRTPAEVAECAEFLGRYFDRIVVVLVIRRADYWLPSAYPESVKAGGTYRFDLDYVRTRRRALDHRALTDRWHTAFGRGRVACVPFLETDKKALHALPDRILRAGGLTEENIVWAKPLSSPANSALSAMATEVLRTANPVLRTSALRPTAARIRAVSYIAENWPGPPILLTDAALHALNELDLPLRSVAQSELAVGDEWSAWVDQLPAPLGPQLVLSPSERDSILRNLQHAGLVRRHETHLRFRPARRQPDDAAAAGAAPIAQRLQPFLFPDLVAAGPVSAGAGSV